MNRLVIAGLIFIIILGLCIGAGIIAHTRFETIKEDLSLCVRQYDEGNTEESLNIATTLNEKWIKVEDRLSIIMNHGRIDDIRIHFARLKAFLEAQNAAGFKSEAAELFALIDQLEEDEKITVHSIF